MMRHSIENVTPASTGKAPSLASARRATVFRRLIAGFLIILVLLGLDALVGSFGTNFVNTTLSSLRERQSLSLNVVHELLRAQSALRALEQSNPASGQAPRETLREALAKVKLAIPKLLAHASPSDSDISLWREVRDAASSIGVEADVALAFPNVRDRLSALIERLVQSDHEKVQTTGRQIEDAVLRQSIEDRVLLSACVLVASLFLWSGTRIYNRMGEQAEELNQVSWQLLERQEALAQRLSRELHDELGQSLTALKTNFSRYTATGCANEALMQDCNELLKGSIRSAHEISELLRPTLLDDFGIDSALLWLCERFEERNRIEVTYRSDFHWRLGEEAETHVFRIAQEALTNVVRHAAATAVDVVFSKQSGVVRLKVADNGSGLRPYPVDSLHFGLTGMKARARSLDGEMNITSIPGKGVTIEVIFPAKA